MKTKLPIIVLSALFALSLAGCSSSSQQSGQQSDGQQQPQQQTQAKDFDGSAFEETADGIMYLATSGGTSENGNVPHIVGGKSVLLMQIEMRTDGFNGEICTVYVDGMELEKTNVGTSQLTLNLQGDMLSKGVHTVELVRIDGDTPSIYKKASYEIVY